MPGPPCAGRRPWTGTAPRPTHPPGLLQKKNLVFEDSPDYSDIQKNSIPLQNLKKDLSKWMPKNWRMQPLISEFIQLNLQQLLEMDIQLHVLLWLRQLLVSISMSWGKFNLKLNFKNHKDWQFIILGLYFWDLLGMTTKDTTV